MEPKLIIEPSKKPKSKIPKIIGGVIIIAIIAVVILSNTVMSNKLVGSNMVIDQKTAVVKRGDINIAVKGAGPIYFTNSNKLYSRVNATIKKINFKIGDEVKAGDVIYELDDKDVKNSIDISKQGLKQSQVSQGASNEAVSDLSISAPFTGQVSNIAVNVGDKLQPGGLVLTITDTSKLKVLLAFNATDVAQITIGEVAKVNITSLMQSVNGTVTYISNQPSSTISGGQLYTVEIQLNNPGAIIGGMTASADVKTSKGSVVSTNSAILNYITKQSVISKTGGTVQRIVVKEDQKVNSGAQLIQIENSAVIRAQEVSNIAIETSQDQINLASSQLEYFNITSPIDGVLSSVNFQVGDTLNAGALVSEVSDIAEMKFNIPVDEIDIAKIAVGQNVNISVNSISSTLTTPVKGEVDTVAVKGVFVSGVTTYLVTIKVEGGFDILKGGMNANAEVEAINKKDVLYVPVSAITKEDGKSYVSLKGNVEKRSEVELGVSNADYIEIKSGLIEGDEVLLTQPF